MHTFWQDLRYGARMLLKAPNYTLIAILMLSLGIGANTTMFSVVNAVLLRSLPYEDPDRLVAIWATHPQAGREGASLPDFLDWREQSRSFERMEASTRLNFSLTGREDPERLIGEAITADFFTLLGIRPILGRGFLPEEERRAASKVVILSHRLWVRGFGSDPNVIGRSITLNGRDYTVVGIAPTHFWRPGDSALWVPLTTDLTQADRRGNYLEVIARLRPGVGLTQARAEMNSITARLEKLYPQTNGGWRADLVSFHEQIVGATRATLLVLLGAVGFVLLIVCANVANLALARATLRGREIAIRAAVGAGRGRIVRQLLTESLLLALLGGALGGLLARWGTSLLVRLGPQDIPRLNEIGVDGRVLGFAFLLTIATGVIFGIAPALQVSRIDLNYVLKSGGHTGASSGGRGRLPRILVVSEVALSLILLVGAFLMIKSLHRLINLDAGFNRENLLTLQIVLPQTKYEADHQVSAFYQRLIENVRGTPGVVSATTVSPLPLSGGRYLTSFVIAGRPAPPPDVIVDASVLYVGDRYIETMGVPLAFGRPLTEQDSQGGPKGALINQSLARRYFRDQDPIGQQISLGLPQNLLTPWMTIAGVVADVKHQATEKEVYPAIYIPQTWSVMSLVVRAHDNPLNLVPAIRSEIRSLERDILVNDIRTMDQVLGTVLEQRRFTMLLMSIFAAVALALAAVGLYGVMSFAVSQRTREIGVRMALGAQASDVLTLVVGQGLKLALTGVLIGLGGALALTRLMKTMLFDVNVADSLSFTLIALLLILVALLASWIPARRATKIDPMVALRAE